MEIILLHQKQHIDIDIFAKTPAELYFALKKYFRTPIREAYLVRPDKAFIALENTENLDIHPLKDELFEKEISFYQLYKKAEIYAPQAHGAQKYDGFLPYFYHLRQADKVLDYFASDIPLGHFFELKTATLLHDVLEDTAVDFQTLSAAFTPHIADIVLKVTKINEEHTLDFERRYYHEMGANPLSVYVKIADKMANGRQTLKNKSAWHAKRLVAGHPIFQAETYHLIDAPQLKAALDKLIFKLEKING